MKASPLRTKASPKNNKQPKASLTPALFLNCEAGGSIDIVMRQENGEETVLDLPIIKPIRFTGPAKAMVKYSERELSFNLGQILSISPKQLYEICYFVTIVTDEIVKELTAAPTFPSALLSSLHHKCADYC
jgi:hypothetical protein